MSRASNSEIVRLQSSDGEIFEVSMESAKTSRTLATMLEDLGHQPGDLIPLPNVTSKLLKKVLAWIDHHLGKTKETPSNAPTTPPQPGSTQATPTTVPPPFQPRLQSRVPQRTTQPHTHHPPARRTLTQWEKEFVKKNKDDIYDLLLAANYLDIKALLDILCQTVAEVIKGKDPEVIRQTFHASHPHTEDPPFSQEAHNHTPPSTQDELDDVEQSSSSKRHRETPV